MLGMLNHRFAVSVWICLSGWLAVNVDAQNGKLEFDREQIFNEVWTLARDHFYDEHAVGDSWEEAKNRFQPKALEAESHIDFAQEMNAILATLKTSHTAYFGAAQQKRSQILGIFTGLVPADREDLFFYDCIGIETEVADGKCFVRAVYDGFPASQAGILYGDEILSVDDQPFSEVDSFRGKRAVQIKLLRKPSEPAILLTVPVKRLDGRTMFESALLSSARVIEKGQQKVAYVHVWSYAGSMYQEHLKNLLLFRKLKDADALVLDLRDGWGGASLEYLSLFQPPIAELSSRPRSGPAHNFSGVWQKPVVLLVNRRTTSGKELLTYGFMKLKLGTVVGETTAGAVVAGRAFLLSNGDVLYLAVSDLEIDGTRLEGQGVQPTVVVERPLPYAGGADPQLDRAVELLTAQ